ncbi:hypothetical protein VF21_04433 [Pseudogymnoascus sp. 05NY08]|nr:hypothetical protein VF21_04433 [Pseudogymnoascus sp. 05NY08]
MDTRRAADDVHAFPLEKKAAEEAHLNDIHWPLTMGGAPTLIKSYTQPTPSLLVPRSPPGDTTGSSSSGDSTTSSASAASTTAECGPNDTSSKCEKPQTASSSTIAIIVGVTVPVVIIIIALIYLHRRHIRKTREEDANDKHKSLDFGLGMPPHPGARKGKKLPNGLSDYDMSEKPGHKGQLSLDIISPYLLPPGLNNSTESLHSLSRSIHNKEDPYRPVNELQNDNASMRSGFGAPRRGDGSSTYTGHTGHSGKSTAAFGLVRNASQMGSTDGQGNNEFSPPPRQASLAKNTLPGNGPAHIEPAYFPKNSSLDGGVQRKGLPSSPRDSNSSKDGERNTSSFRLSNNYLGSMVNGGDRMETPPPSAPAKDNERSPFSDSAALDMPMGPTSLDDDRDSEKNSPPQFANSLPANPRPPRLQSLPQDKSALPEIPQITHDQNWLQDDYGNDGFVVTPPSPTQDAAMKRASRYSMDVPPEEYANAGLGAPGVDPRRISMGFRPLPPTLAVESDDPEVRANRIRSFYKEYFDDSKPAPAGEYYEDYDDGAYYDPHADAYEAPIPQPYAQPMARRAFTPPPGAQRFMGQAPPRGSQGSGFNQNYNNNYGPGPGGPPRAFHGSMSSRSMNQWRGPAPGFQEPRPFSSASNRRPNTAQQRRPMAPLADLNTIPTPAMMKDDSFAIMNAADFVAPTSYKERAQGRSQSPMGERRAYSPAVPVYKPLVSAFDELAVIPSPHSLRKSGTFTSLDFAPPKRVFRDQDTMSDAGSIRSNRSGVSAMQLQAIRSGAHRVSRLPGDSVSTKDDMIAALKPTWGLRNGE